MRTHDCELFDDSAAIADPTSYIYTAMAMHAPTSRESIESCTRHLPALQKAAARIAATMAPPRTGLPDEKPNPWVQRARRARQRQERAVADAALKARKGIVPIARNCRPA